jgi:N-acylneuraminate cytidylyltransferase
MSKNTGCVVLSEMEVQDIDNEIDWKLAELKYKLLHEIS